MRIPTAVSKGTSPISRSSWIRTRAQPRCASSFPTRKGSCARTCSPSSTSFPRASRAGPWFPRAPNMFAVVHFVSQGFQSRAVVPASAVLRLQDRDWVFIKLSENQFRRTEVQAGPAHPDGMQQILTGVRAGDQVVANALQFDREARKD